MNKRNYKVPDYLAIAYLEYHYNRLLDMQIDIAQKWLSGELPKPNCEQFEAYEKLQEAEEKLSKMIDECYEGVSELIRQRKVTQRLLGMNPGMCAN